MSDFKPARIRLLAVAVSAACVAPVLAQQPAPASPPTSAPERQLGEVTVRSTSDALEEQRNAATQKTIVDRKEIEALGGLTVGELIRKLPGIDAGEHGADGGMNARARGMSRDGVQFLVNGERPTANARFALTEVGRMPSGELERVEILRGGSAEFGGAAPVTVNLVMRRPVARAAASVKLAVGQRGSLANGQFTASHGGGDGGFSWLLPLTLNRHAMPVDQSTTRTLAGGALHQTVVQDVEQGRYGINEFIVSPRLAWRSATGQLTLWPSLYYNEGDRSTHTVRSDGTQRHDSEDNSTRIARLRSEAEWRAWGGKWTGRVATMQGQRNAERQRQSTGVVDTAWHETERREDREHSASLRYDRPVGPHLLSVGLDAVSHRRDDWQALSGAYASDTRFAGRARQGTLWLQDEWKLAEALTLTGGLRGERMAIHAQARDSRHGAADPSLALRWEAAPGWVARSSLSGAIRFPKLDELTGVASHSTLANTPLEPDRGGNPWLRPERVANLEVGLERHVSGGVWGINTYLRRTQDFIERRTLWEVGRWVDRPTNEGDARHWGLELSAKLTGDAPWLQGLIGRQGSVRTQFTLPCGEVQDAVLGATRTPRDLPRYQFTLGYEGSLPEWQSTWGFQWQHQGAARTQVPGEVQATRRSRNLLDAHAVRRITPALNLRLSVQNLLGKGTWRTASTSQGGQAWMLTSSETGQRTWLLALEGKW
jgi:iron complex outermembrane receptor protein